MHVCITWSSKRGGAN